MKHYLIIVFLCNVSFSFSQEIQQKSLKKILLFLENKNNVKFSFSDDTIADKRLYINTEKTLEEILKEIVSKTDIYINKITDRYYTVTKTANKAVTVCGYVLNTTTKDVLIGATISNLDETKGVITNEYGNFNLEKVILSDSIKISFIGYKTIIKPVKEFYNKKCLSIYLEEKTALLDEVIVRNYLTSGIRKNSDGSITFDPKKQGVLPGLTEPDVLLSIQQLPGIQSPLETASGLHIRGGTPDQNLILFDGIKLFNTSHFFGSISAFNPHVIDNVTVYRGASNSKYGNHIAGVIDIKTMIDVPKKTSGSVGINFTNVDAYLKTAISEKIGVSISGRHSISSFFDTPTFQKLSTKVFQNTIISEGTTLAQQPFIETDNVFNFTDYNTKIIYKLTKNDVFTAQQIHIENKLNYRLENFEEKELRNDNLKIKNNGYGLSWNKKWHPLLEQKTNLYYSNYEFLYKKTQSKENTPYIFSDKENTIKNIGLETTFNKKFSMSSNLNFGYHYAYNDILFRLEKKYTNWSYTEFNAEHNTNNVHTIFAEHIYNSNNKYIIHTGLRTNFISLINKTTFEPRISAKIRFSPSFWVNASYENKQQYSSKIIEFFTTDFGLENQLWVLSNKNNIPLLKSNQVTIGALFKKNRWLIDFNIYKRKIDGLTSLTSGFNVYKETIFIGKATTLGLEFLAKKKWDNYNIWLSYTTDNTTFLFDGFNENKTFSGNFSVSQSIYIAQQLKIKNFDISLGWNYRAGIPFSSLMEVNSDFVVNIKNYNNTNLPDYHRLDLSSNYNFYLNTSKNIKANVGVSFLNIYNRKNILKRSHEGAIGNNNARLINRIDTNSLGFTPNISFRVSF